MTKENSINLTWEELHGFFTHLDCAPDKCYIKRSMSVDRFSQIESFLHYQKGIIQIIEEGEIHHFCESCTKEQKKKIEKESLNDQ